MNSTKEAILAIADKLREGTISTNIALHQIFELKGRIYNGVSVTGTAKVKENTKWVYAGLTLPIIRIDSIVNNGFGIYPDGSKHYRLSLEGTSFAERKYTVIHEKDLEIIELNVTDLNEE